MVAVPVANQDFCDFGKAYSRNFELPLRAFPAVKQNALRAVAKENSYLVSLFGRHH